MTPRPPTSTLFPYTTLFRSVRTVEKHGRNEQWKQRLQAIKAQAAAETSRALGQARRSEEHTSELQSRFDLVCRLLLEKKNAHIFQNQTVLKSMVAIPRSLGS